MDYIAQVWHHRGAWIADCPRPGCINAEHFGPDPAAVRLLRAGHKLPKPPHVGGLKGERFACSHCGLMCDVNWPPYVDDIDALLALRPIPDSRNWLPGETLDDLIAQNLEAGIMPPMRLVIVDNRIVEGRRELMSAARRMIESGV